jgi:hypothetical protein
MKLSEICIILVITILPLSICVRTDLLSNINIRTSGLIYPSTNTSAYDVPIITNGETKEAWVANRVDPSQCHAVSRVWESPRIKTRQFLLFSNTSLKSAKISISKHTGDSIVAPTIKIHTNISTFNLDPTTNPESTPNPSLTNPNKISSEEKSSTELEQESFSKDVSEIEKQTMALSPNSELKSLAKEIEESKFIFFSIEYSCESNLADDEQWSFITVKIEFANEGSVQFEVLKICTWEFTQGLDASILVLMATIMIVMILATKQSESFYFEKKQIQKKENELKTIHVILFIVFASAFLVLMFFFLEFFSIFLTVMLSFSTTFMIGFYLTAVFQKLHFNSIAFFKHQIRIPCLGTFSTLDLLSLSLALCLVLFWAFTKNWVLNNILGIILIFFFLGTLKFSSIKIGMLLLCLAFVYDIFWVFFSSYIFGSNVMVTVATGLDLPIKLEFPHMGPFPTLRCSLIGLGDLVLPGLLISFCNRFGHAMKTSAYYVSSLLGYFCAIVICEYVVVVHGVAQPALLYISPFCLLSVIAVALFRKEFSKMWSGIQQTGNEAGREKIEQSEIDSEIIQNEMGTIEREENQEEEKKREGYTVLLGENIKEE